VGRGRVHGGAAIWTERIFNLADIPGFRKEISLFSPCPRFLRYPKSTAVDPKLARRTKLIMQLEQQRELAKDEGYVVKRQKWVKGRGRLEQLVDAPKRVKRWWRCRSHTYGDRYNSTDVYVETLGGRKVAPFIFWRVSTIGFVGISNRTNSARTEVGG
jgi:hypothetical protein